MSKLPITLFLFSLLTACSAAPGTDMAKEYTSTITTQTQNTAIITYTLNEDGSKNIISCKGLGCNEVNPAPIESNVNTPQQSDIDQDIPIGYEIEVSQEEIMKDYEKFLAEKYSA